MIAVGLNNNDSAVTPNNPQTVVPHFIDLYFLIKCNLNLWESVAEMSLTCDMNLEKTATLVGRCESAVRMCIRDFLASG